MFSLGLIRDAIRVGVEAGRAKWPEGVWFHSHGFGANSRKAWMKLWQILKLDGFEFNCPPAGLLITRLNNIYSDYWYESRDYWSQYRTEVFRKEYGALAV